MSPDTSARTVKPQISDKLLNGHKTIVGNLEIVVTRMRALSAVLRDLHAMQKAAVERLTTNDYRLQPEDDNGDVHEQRFEAESKLDDLWQPISVDNSTCECLLNGSWIWMGPTWRAVSEPYVLALAYEAEIQPDAIIAPPRSRLSPEATRVVARRIAALDRLIGIDLKEAVERNGDRDGIESINAKFEFATAERTACHATLVGARVPRSTLAGIYQEITEASLEIEIGPGAFALPIDPVIALA